MRNKVRKSLAFLLALALVVSVMSGLGLSVSADEGETPVPVAEEQEQPQEDKQETPAEEPAEEEEPAGEGSGEATVASLYDRLLACTTVEAVDAILDNLTEEEQAEMDAFTEEQNTALETYLDGLGYYATDATPGPGGPGGGGGGPGGESQANECDQSYYQSTAEVYWDTMTYNRTTKKGTSYADGRTKVGKVQLTSTNVQQADATSPTKASGGTQMGQYFYGATIKKEVSSTLTITPTAGYYITDVVIACTGGSSNESAFQCNTWSEGNAFTTGFNVGTSGSVSIQVSSKDFSHRSQAKKVFILIAVAPIPTPLYVEYWAGEITNESDDTIFSNSDQWTSQDDKNELGTGSVQTNYTQYQYAYDNGNSSDAAGWKHYANSITDDAKTAAAEAGYYFTGWKVEYYTECSATSEKNSDRTYTYTFSNAYGTATSDIQPGENVSLTTNCKLTAQWEPIQMKVTKVVKGLPDNYSIQNTYTLQVKKVTDNGDSNYSDEITLNVTGNGNAGQTLSTVPAGTYKVEETVGNSDITVGTDTYICSTACSENVTIDKDTGNTVKELTVTNTYTKQENGNLTIKKAINVDGDEYAGSDFDNTNFTFTVSKMNDDGQTDTSLSGKYSAGDNKSVSFNDGSATVTVTGASSVTIEDLPAGSYIVTETTPSDMDKYNFDSDGSATTTTAMVSSGNTTTAEITNKYTTKTFKVTVEKVVTGNMSQTSDEFAFTVANESVKDDDKTFNLTGNTANGANQEEFTVKYGESFTVTETDTNGYTLDKIEVGGEEVTFDNNGYTINNVTADTTITFTNNKTINPPSGVTRTIAPFVIMAVLAAGAGVYFVYSRRQRD